MIGLVGPEESVQGVLDVATEMGCEQLLLPQLYERIEEAPQAAQRIAPMSQLILFTGRMACAMARASGELAPPLDCVDHTTADFARALFIMATRFGGAVPEISVDLFDHRVLDETCADLGLPTPTLTRVVSSDPDEIRNQESLVQSIVDFHGAAWADGRAQACLTTFYQAARALSDQGVPTVRVAHTRSSIRRALQRAQAAVDLGRAQRTQLVIGLLRITRPELSSSSRAYLDAEVERLAELLRGSCAQRDERTFVIHTTLGTLRDALDVNGVRTLVDLIDGRGVVGFGTGPMATGAEENAELALKLAEEPRPEPAVFLVMADGTVRNLVAGSALPIRETRPELLALSQRLNLGVHSLHRLAAVLANFDTDQIGARDLAIAYGVSTRTARRILTSLQEQGIAAQSGSGQGPGAGRPQKLYRVDMRKLAGVKLAEPRW
ncbi:MAG TPA: hypothetical protein VJ735_20530 [Actinomycetes bacterium]|nr:hypothetical protein [Actinomycetes bacterium]